MTATETFTIAQLKQVIDLRVNDKLTWEQIADVLPISVYQLKALSPVLNQYRPCRRCHRPVFLGVTPNKEYCNATCNVNYHKGNIHYIEVEDQEIPGRKFTLTRAQIAEAFERRYEFNEDLAPIAKDLGVDVNTLSRTLKDQGGKSLVFSRYHECIVCYKPFTSHSNARYCSGKCRTIAYRGNKAGNPNPLYKPRTKKQEQPT